MAYETQIYKPTYETLDSSYKFGGFLLGAILGGVVGVAIGSSWKKTGSLESKLN